MCIKLETVRKPCTLYPSCPYAIPGAGEQNNIYEILPDLPSCGNCSERPISTPETEPGKWTKIS